MYTLSLALTTATTVLAPKAHRPAQKFARFGRICHLRGRSHARPLLRRDRVARPLTCMSCFCWPVTAMGYLSPARPASPGVTRGRPTARFLFRWPLAQIGAAALSAPWLINAWQTLTSYHGNGDSPALGAIPVAVLRRLRPGRNSAAFPFGDSTAAFLAAAVIALGVLFGVLSARRKVRQSVCESPNRIERDSSGKQLQATFRGHSPSLLLLLCLFIPLLATWVSARERPIFNERYLIAALPPFSLLLAMGMASIGERVDEWLGWRWRSWVGRTRDSRR